MANNTVTSGFRTLHLVDIENLCGGVDFSEAEVECTMSEYSVVAARTRGDHTIVASCHRAAAAAWFGCREARRLVRSGENGADLALLEVIQTENVAGRFARVVIGSGDGVFSDAVAWLQQQGVEVVVVSRRGHLSRRLELAVREVRFLAPPRHPTAPAAGWRAA